MSSTKKYIILELFGLLFKTYNWFKLFLYHHLFRRRLIFFLFCQAQFKLKLPNKNLFIKSFKKKAAYIF